jgi:hypothetical protein
LKEGLRPYYGALELYSRHLIAKHNARFEQNKMHGLKQNRMHSLKQNKMHVLKFEAKQNGLTISASRFIPFMVA